MGRKIIDGSLEVTENITVNNNSVETKNNKVTTLSDSSTNDQYPSAKVVYDGLESKQDTIDSSHKLDYSLLQNTPTLGTASALNVGTSSGDIPVLGENGKLAVSVIPQTAISDTYVVASQVAMLNLPAQVGDICVRTDLNKTFILRAEPASTLGNWQELLTPTDAVTSVNGRTGAVTGLEEASNKVTSLSYLSTDTQYPSAKAVYDATYNLEEQVEELNDGKISFHIIDENTTISSLKRWNNGQGNGTLFVQIISGWFSDNQYYVLNFSTVTDAFHVNLYPLSKIRSTYYYGAVNPASDNTVLSTITLTETNKYCDAPTNGTQVVNKNYVDNAISTKEDTSNKVTSLSSSSTNTQYPSAKAVYDFANNNYLKIKYITGSTTVAELDTETEIIAIPSTSIYYQSISLFQGDVYIINVIRIGENRVVNITPIRGSVLFYQSNTVSSQTTTLLSELTLTSHNRTTGTPTSVNDIVNKNYVDTATSDVFKIVNVDVSQYSPLTVEQYNDIVNNFPKVKLLDNNIYFYDFDRLDSDDNDNNIYIFKRVGVFNGESSIEYLNILSDRTYTRGSTSGRFAGLSPIASNTSDLGSVSYKWKDLYLSGNIGNGTQAYTLYESYGAMFNPTTTGTTIIKWSQLLTFSLSANTTFTFESAKSGCLNEYKAIITNSGSSAITITLPSGITIVTNDDNIIINSNTFTLPSGVTIELSCVNQNCIVFNFNA